MPPFYFLTFAKVSVSVSKKFGLKKVSVSVSKTFGLEKKSRYRSRKHLVSKKSLGIGLENIWSRKKVSVSVSKILVSKKSLGIGLDEIFWSRHSVHQAHLTHLSSEKHYNVFTRPSTLAGIGVYFLCAFEERIADFTLLDLANSHVTATIVSPHTSFLRAKYSITCLLAMSASPRVTLVHLHWTVSFRKIRECLPFLWSSGWEEPAIVERRPIWRQTPKPLRWLLVITVACHQQQWKQRHYQRVICPRHWQDDCCKCWGARGCRLAAGEVDTGGQATFGYSRSGEASHLTCGLAAHNTFTKSLPTNSDYLSVLKIRWRLLEICIQTTLGRPGEGGGSKYVAVDRSQAVVGPLGLSQISEWLWLSFKGDGSAGPDRQ